MAQHGPFSSSIAKIASAFLSGPTSSARLASQTKQRLQLAQIEKLNRENTAAQGDVTAQGQIGAAIRTALGGLPTQRAPSESFVGPQPLVSRGENVRAQLPDIASGLVDLGKGTDIGSVFRAIMANSGAGDQFVDASLAGAGSPITLAQVKGRVASRAVPTLDDRSLATLMTTLNAPSFRLVEGPEGQTGRIDVNDPNAVVERVPGRRPGPGGVGSVIEAMDLQGLLGSSGNAEATAARRTREAEAASLGITTSELDLLKLARNLIGADVRGYRGLPEGLRAEYLRISKKISLATSGAPLPPGFQVVQ